MLALNTLSRPDAITDITWKQVDESGLIDLNPPGRRQTRRYRPIVPMTETLDDWLRAWKDGQSHIVHYKSQAIADPKKAFRDTAIAAGLMDATEPNQIDRAVTPYTLSGRWRVCFVVAACLSLT